MKTEGNTCYGSCVNLNSGWGECPYFYKPKVYLLHFINDV